MPSLIEVEAEIKTERGKQEKLFREVAPDGDFTKSAISPAIQKEIIDREMELAKLELSRSELLQANEAFKAYQKTVREEAKNITDTFGGGGGSGGANPLERMGYENRKSLGDYFIESKTYKARKNEEEKPFSVDAIKMRPISFEAEGASVKTLFQTTAGYAPFVPRDGTVIFTPQRRPRVADLIPITETNVPGTRYMEETSFTNNAAAVAEGATKPESALQLTERFLGMSKIATSLPVTEEQMDDIPQIRDYINNRLGLMWMLEEDRELLLGSGTLPEMYGFLNKTGVQTVTKGALDDFSAVLKAIVQVEETVGFADVNGVVFHPLDFFAFRTKQDGTGRFIMGDPSAVGDGTIWGKTPVRTPVMTQGNILLGDFNTYSQILRKMGMTFRVGYVNDQFLKNQMTILVEGRELLIIYRANAFAIVTGTF
jgi:HK97 family phage major capsid protein